MTTEQPTEDQRSSKQALRDLLREARERYVGAMPANDRDRESFFQACAAFIKRIDAALVVAADEPPALHHEQIKAICHALTDNCVMVDDPERPPCTFDNCAAMKAARAAPPPTAARFKVGDSVEFTNRLQQTFVGIVKIVDSEPRYAIAIGDEKDRNYVCKDENELRAVTKIAPPGDRCSECDQPLPPVTEWSMPACPDCVEKAEAADETTVPYVMKPSQEAAMFKAVKQCAVETSASTLPTPASFGLVIDGDPQFIKACSTCNRDYIGGVNDACPREDCNAPSENDATR